MRRPVRTVEAFYETDGKFTDPYRYAVSEEFAGTIFRRAAAIVGRYTGPIAVARVRGVRLPEEPAAVDISKVGLGSAPHTMLITRRKETGKSGPQPTGRTLPARIAASVIESKIVISTPPAYEDMTGGKTLTVAVHEMGHSFGLGEPKGTEFAPVQVHCPDEACIMTETPRVAADGMAYAIASGKPFCDPCAGELELAGYMALAAQL
jgi:hypothetical protein